MRRNPSPQPHCPARTRSIGAMEQYRRARVIWLPNSGILPADLLLPPGRRMAHTAFMAPMGYRNTGL